jgi:antirestriction protein ArdC
MMNRRKASIPVHTMRRVARKHPRAVFTAASKAQQAVDYLIGKQQQTGVDEAA